MRETRGHFRLLVQKHVDHVGVLVDDLPTQAHVDHAQHDLDAAAVHVQHLRQLGLGLGLARALGRGLCGALCLGLCISRFEPVGERRVLLEHGEGHGHDALRGILCVRASVGGLVGVSFGCECGWWC